MYRVNFRKADRFVAQQQGLGVDVRWDGYKMIFFRPDERAMKSQDGVFRNGAYGFANTFEMNNEGVFEIDTRNLRRPEKSRRR